MTIVIGSDHGGFNLKKDISLHLKSLGYDVLDVGTHDGTTCAYPEIAKEVATLISEGKYEKGILICGTGIGISIAANKIPGIRAAVCSDHFSARCTRLHNNANILCLGERVVGVGTALELVDLFLNTEYEGGRHDSRIDMITSLEK